MKIVIKAVDAQGVTGHYSVWSSVEMAEKAFDAYTHEPLNQELNWMLIDGDGDQLNWHCPLNVK